MGILWEIVQTGLMYGQKRHSDRIEDRVADVEARIAALEETIRKLVKAIEERYSEDIDGDGNVG